MNTAFVVSGLLLLVGVTGAVQSIRQVGAVARRTCSALLALSPLGVILDGIFTLESMLLHSVGFFLARDSGAELPGRCSLASPCPALAALWQLAAFGQSADTCASGPVLHDLQSDDIWGWARSGRFGTTRIDRRGPRVVRGPRPLAFSRSSG
jgi:hypothetical protein